MFELDANAPNIFPAQYRQVAVADLDIELTLRSLRDHFLGKEAYLTTRFIVARSGPQTALVEITKEDDGPVPRPGEAGPLFSLIVSLRLLAGPGECASLHAPEADVGVPSHLAALVEAAPDARCIIVEGRYSHISFLLNPEVLRVTVLDIVPPHPSKLLDQVARVLDTAEDLPPILVGSEPIDSVDLLTNSTVWRSGTDNTTVLVPCRGGGVEVDGVSVAYLDERPPKQEWTLLGCARSAQIHRSFYNSSAPTIDTCPRQFLTAERHTAGATLTRCCLLQDRHETSGRAMLVPWGSSLAEVRTAIEILIEAEGFVWTPT